MRGSEIVSKEKKREKPEGVVDYFSTKWKTMDRYTELGKNQIEVMQC